MALEEMMMNLQRAKAVAAIAAWVFCWSLFTLSDVGSAERLLRAYNEPGYFVEKEMRQGFVVRLLHFFWQLSGKSSYQHVWPEMEFGWRLVIGSVIGFFGAALGSVGGVGGGGIFVPMLSLIIGFDPNSSTAISKCVMMGAAAGSTVYYILRLRHPTLDLPLIIYDLALLFQAMLLLGISMGVPFNVIFADWMVTVLLLVLFMGTSTKALFRGIDAWKKETKMKRKEAAKLLESDFTLAGDQNYGRLPNGAAASEDDKVPVLCNIYWKELGLPVFVWVAFLTVQIMKVPIAVSVTIYEAMYLYKGTRVIASKGKEITNWKAHTVAIYCCCGMVARILGGLLGLGGGLILGPLFLELGVPPQVASATSTFAMAFSSAISVVQYYLLKRFPVALVGPDTATTEGITLC